MEKSEPEDPGVTGPWAGGAGTPSDSCVFYSSSKEEQQRFKVMTCKTGSGERDGDGYGAEADLTELIRG